MVEVGPSSYVHFSQAADAFHTRIIPPPISQLPPAKVGMTIMAWIRVGHVGDLPISSFVEFNSVLSKDPMTSSSANGRKTTHLFFRSAYKIASNTPYDKLETGSITSGVSNLLKPEDDNDINVIDVENTKKVLHLCISTFTPSMSLPVTSETLASLMVPHIVIEYDWEESDRNWKLLTLTFSESMGGGVSCSVNDIPRRVRQWAPLGYTDLTDDPHSRTELCNKLYPGLSHASSEVTIGGLNGENELYTHRIEALTEWTKQAYTGIGDKESDELHMIELLTLQCFKNLVGGFSGDISELIVMEGAFNDDADIMKLYEEGPSVPLPRKSTVGTGKCLLVMSPNMIVKMQESKTQDNGNKADSKDDTDDIRVDEDDTNDSRGVYSGSSSSTGDGSKQKDRTPSRLHQPANKEDETQPTAGIVSDFLGMIIGSSSNTNDSRKGDKKQHQQRPDLISLCHGDIDVCKTNRLVDVILEQG